MSLKRRTGLPVEDGLQEFDADLFDEPRIAGKPEHEVHLVHLAPGH
jgi:hypothetical protein